MTDRALLQQALDALENLQGLCAEESDFVEQVTIWTPEVIDALRQRLAQPEPEGWKWVPVKPTREMLNAAIDVDSFKLGDISPLGFRCSPQRLFERCYTSMLSAAPQKGTL